MSKPMTFKEFGEVLDFIQEHRSFISGDFKYPRVKYIDPVFDMRTSTVFAVTFRGGSHKSFSTVNEGYLKESLKERIMQWLNTPKEMK